MLKRIFKKTVLQIDLVTVTLYSLILLFFIKFFKSFISQIKLNPYNKNTPLPDAIQAANNGNFLMYDFNPIGKSNPAELKTFDDLGAFEHGPAFLMHLAKFALGLLNFNFTPSTLTPIYFWYLLLSIIIVLIFIGCGGNKERITLVICLYICFSSVHTLTNPSIGGRSLPGLSTLLMGISLSNLLVSTKTIYKVTNIIALSIIGLFPFLREDTIVAYAFSPIFILLLFIVFFSLFKHTKNIFNWVQFFKILIFSLIPFISYYLMKFVLKIILIKEWQRDFEDIKLINHGSGHSLFLGLGYTDNPYNIAWSDFNGLIQAKIFSGDPYFCDYYSVECLTFLKNLYFNLILHDPFTLFSNVIIKIEDTLIFIYKTEYFSSKQYIGINTDISFKFISVIVTFIFLYLIFYSLFKAMSMKNITLIVISLSFIISAFIIPIVIFPTYVSAVQGGLILLIFNIQAFLSLNYNKIRIPDLQKFKPRT